MKIRSYPEYVKQWIATYTPYVNGGNLDEGAPEAARDAYEKMKAWMLEQGQ